MEEGKVTKVGKLHGQGPDFATGPARGHKAEYSKIEKRGPQPSLETGPKRSGQELQKKYDGNAGGTMKTGTKGDESGEDSGGKASGKRGDVKGY